MNWRILIKQLCHFHIYIPFHYIYILWQLLRTNSSTWHINPLYTIYKAYYLLLAQYRWDWFQHSQHYIIYFCSNSEDTCCDPEGLSSNWHAQSDARCHPLCSRCRRRQRGKNRLGCRNSAFSWTVDCKIQVQKTNNIGCHRPNIYAKLKVNVSINKIADLRKCIYNFIILKYMI